VAEALTADRPYRGTVLEIMGRDAGTKLDPTVFRALEGFLPERQAAVAERGAAQAVAA
jgi:HD-GYP domain-containing protein (c-di-GMP phosphodiesterase class II)